jgi:signal transduction histidine kinase
MILEKAKELMRTEEQLSVAKGEGSESRDADPLIPPSIKLPRSMLEWDVVDEGLSKVETLFQRASLVGFGMWLVLLFAVFRFAPVTSFEEPAGLEKSIHFVTAIIILVTNGSRIIPLFFRDFSFGFFKSGFLIATMSVQAIAIGSNLVLALIPTPVMVDHHTGLRVHLIRWVEWIPLAFLMTFLTCNVDVQLRKYEPSPVNFKTPTFLALSTSAGMVFPFCPDSKTWYLVLLAAWALFSSIYVLAYDRATNYYQLQSMSTSCIDSGPQKESLDLARASYNLTLICSITWTLLALSFTIVCLISRTNPESWLATPDIPIFLMTIFEVMSKIWYFSALIATYDKIFDENARAVRRLEEMRGFMSAVWASSSDVVVFCVEKQDGISARISPAFLKMLGLSTGSSTLLDDRGDVSIILEISPENDCCTVFAMDLTKPISRQDAAQFKHNLMARKFQLDDNDAILSTEDRNLLSMAKLVVHTFKTRLVENTGNLTASFVKREGETEKSIPCEAKISGLEKRAYVLVLRDISDRLERFEAEKKLVEEITSRKKDTEANIFTRHEVKNGILAAIGLLDHIRDFGAQRGHVIPAKLQSFGSKTGESSSSPDHNSLARHSRPQVETLSGENSAQEDEFKESVTELDSTLRDMLDTILDEAMAREIIHGEYKPKKERMIVQGVLDSIRRRTSQRFPLQVLPDPFPSLKMDRQLLRYIYRNAVSNACKYGEVDGVVETSVEYDREQTRFTLQVVNKPGEGHDELVELTSEEVSLVFAPGMRLRAEAVAFGKKAQTIRNESSGNGAWIMQKCAEAMGAPAAFVSSRIPPFLRFVAPFNHATNQ